MPDLAEQRDLERFVKYGSARRRLESLDAWDGPQTVLGSRNRETLFEMCSVSELFLKCSKAGHSWRNYLPLSSASNARLRASGCPPSAQVRAAAAHVKRLKGNQPKKIRV